MFAQSGINLASFFVAGDVSGDGHLDLVVVTVAAIVYLRNDGQVCAVSPVPPVSEQCLSGKTKPWHALAVQGVFSIVATVFSLGRALTVVDLALVDTDANGRLDLVVLYTSGLFFVSLLLPLHK
jgi:hypothetical protein